MSFEQKASGYALAGAAAVVARSRKTVNHAAVAVTGVGEAPYLVAAASTLIGTRGEAEDRTAVAAGAVAGTVNSDIHAPAEYRTQLTRVAVRRALELALSRAH